ncbi:MAG: TIM44-like domain-containing protein [Elusimicrobiota bacterium]
MTRRQAFLLTFLLFAAADAFARAGGGGGFHGGGGFSSGGGGFHSSGGSSGGGADFISMYIYFVLMHPVFGVPFTIFLLWLFYQLNNTRVAGNEASIDSTISQGLDTELESRRREALALILTRDPHFDENAFLQRASGAFLAIQDAWSSQDMTKARAFISDGVHERFSRQIADYKDRGIRNKMSDVKILEIEALGYVAGSSFDAVYVSVKASVLDQMVTLVDETVLSGGPDEFTEVWTFLRRPGAKTLARPGLLEGHCPSCGAPLEIADAAQCAACKAWVNSGEHDWVLTSITQVSEWAFPSPEREVTGWEDLRETDPGLSLESLEDRAAVAFWRWLDARRRGDLAPLRGVAEDEFLKKANVTGDFERDAAVGAVETVAFETGADYDKAHIQVRWEADHMIRGPKGQDFRGRDRRTHYLVFRRRSGAVSDPKAGLRTARCPSCGAAPEEADAGACPYCGRAFNDGSVSWVLYDAIPFGEWRRPVVDPTAPVAQTGLDWGDELPPAEAVAVLAAGLAAHGTADDRERAYLLAYAERRGVETARAEEMMQAALDKRLSVPAPANAAEAEVILRGLIRMSLADGRIEDGERALLAAFGARLGLSEKDVNLMIREERTALHARAAAALAQRRAAD